MQPYCNNVGFNAQRTQANSEYFGWDRTALVRIGMIANNENSCGSPDSYVGFGGQKMGIVSQSNLGAGNYCKYGCGNGEVNNPAIGYILAR